MKKNTKYKPIIGLEIHAQLSTNTKMFSPEETSYGEIPNTKVSNITLAHPGTMPSVNKKAIEYAIMMGLACKSQINKTNYFYRKNYFYPDLPKGYQITQSKNTIAINGEIYIQLDGKEKSISLNNIQIEEDTGKSLHNVVKGKSLIDYNRAGTPLIEIITQPVLNSSTEAYFLLQEIRKMVRYLEICDGNMEEGSLRCDANISVMPENSKVFGQKVEVKNMNSFRNVQLAIEYEIQRQIEVLNSGKKIINETRTFDPNTQKTISMRLKETGSDYRYYIDPDISPVIINEEWLEDINNKMSVLYRDQYIKFISTYKLSDYDSKVILEDKYLGLFFDEVAKQTQNYKSISNWILGPIKSHLNENKIGIKNFSISPKKIAEIINQIDSNNISFSLARSKVFPKLLSEPNINITDILSELTLHKKSDFKIKELIDQVLKENPDKLKLYKEGKKQLFGMFMGEIIKKSKNELDPKLVSILLKEKLDKI